jgi:membrane protease YdiL (CAAX protease family)
MTLIALSLILCGAAMLSFWFARLTWVSAGLILAGVSLATYSGTVTLVGLGALLFFALSVYVQYKQPKKEWDPIFFGVICITAFGFFTHHIPGFHNYLWLNQAKLSALSAPFNLYLNFDKTIAALIVGLGLCYGSNNIFKGLFQKSVLKSIFSTGLVLSILCILLLMGLGLALNYIAFDFKIPSWFGLWFLAHLIFVCMAEEIVFRGYIQQKLIQYFVAKQLSWMWGLLLASIIFGLLHYRGGPVYIFLATVAGLFYGCAYYKTKRIEASIFVHLLVNTTHFVFFTYPYLAR